MGANVKKRTEGRTNAAGAALIQFRTIVALAIFLPALAMGLQSDKLRGVRFIVWTGTCESNRRCIENAMTDWLSKNAPLPPATSGRILLDTHGRVVTVTGSLASALRLGSPPLVPGSPALSEMIRDRRVFWCVAMNREGRTELPHDAPDVHYAWAHWSSRSHPHGKMKDGVHCLQYRYGVEDAEMMSMHRDL